VSRANIPPRQLTVSVGNLSVILHITACTFRRRRILACDEIHNLIVSAWRNSPEWTVGRYVVMPDHVHLFAAENEFQGYPLGQWIAKWKAHVSRLDRSKRTSPSGKGAFGIIS
jgi:putative transposase